MWGICIDGDLIHKELFGSVVQYEIDNASGKAIISSPVAGYSYDEDKIQALSQAPDYAYGEEAFPCNHPDMRGIIVKIRWHVVRQQYYYYLCISGRLKSKRYFKEDLIKPGE